MQSACFATDKSSNQACGVHVEDRTGGETDKLNPLDFIMLLLSLSLRPFLDSLNGIRLHARLER